MFSHSTMFAISKNVRIIFFWSWEVLSQGTSISPHTLNMSQKKVVAGIPWWVSNNIYMIQLRQCKKNFSKMMTLAQENVDFSMFLGGIKNMIDNCTFLSPIWIFWHNSFCIVLVGSCRCYLTPIKVYLQELFLGSYLGYEG